MIKAIKYGFRCINNNRQRDQNIAKAQKHFEAGHVLEVEEVLLLITIVLRIILLAYYKC